LPSISSLTPTKLPPNTYSLEVRDWPETGNLLKTMDGEVIFETQIWDLSPGGYLVFLDSQEHTVNFASMDTDETGVLIQLDEKLGLPRKLFQRSGEIILAERSSIWRFYNLSSMVAWRIGPLCESIYMDISPKGDWLVGSCFQTERDEQGIKQLISEIVSIEVGKGFRIALPFSGSIYDHRFTWFSDDRLIVSRARDDSRQANCAISFLERLVYCPPIVPANHNITYYVEDLGQFVAFTNLDVFPWEAMLVPTECLLAGIDCSGVVELGKVEGFILASPSFEVVGWITGIGPQEEAKIGIFDPNTWESRQIADLEGNFTIDAWCPDSSCMIIYSEETLTRYRLDLDGSLTPLPYEKVIGSFSIP